MSDHQEAESLVERLRKALADLDAAPKDCPVNSTSRRIEVCPKCKSTDRQGCPVLDVADQKFISVVRLTLLEKAGEGTGASNASPSAALHGANLGAEPSGPLRQALALAIETIKSMARTTPLTPTGEAVLTVLIAALDEKPSAACRFCDDERRCAEEASHIASGYRAAMQQAIRTLRDDTHCEACQSHKIYPSPETVADDLAAALTTSTHPRIEGEGSSVAESARKGPVALPETNSLPVGKGA